MKITIEKLEELKACRDGINYFQKNFGNEAEINDVLAKINIDKNNSYAIWLTIHFHLSGKFCSWHENGNPAVKSNWKNGKRHGLTEWFYEGGNPKVKSNWKNGVKI